MDPQLYMKMDNIKSPQKWSQNALFASWWCLLLNNSRDKGQIRNSKYTSNKFSLWNCRTLGLPSRVLTSPMRSDGILKFSEVGHQNFHVRRALLMMSVTVSSVWVGSHVSPRFAIAVGKKGETKRSVRGLLRENLQSLWRHLWPAASVWFGSLCVSDRRRSLHVERVWVSGFVFMDEINV